MPTRSRSSTWANAATTASSAGVRGARPAPAANTGSGRAARSSLPTGVSGNSSSTTSAAGTRWAGSNSDIRARSASAVGAHPVAASTYDTSTGDPAGPGRPTVTARSTSGSPASAASASPTSIRIPRILTWWSLRPTYSSSSRPAACTHRTTSPVRYIRAPCGCATNRAAVSPGRPW